MANLGNAISSMTTHLRWNDASSGDRGWLFLTNHPDATTPQRAFYLQDKMAVGFYLDYGHTRSVPGTDRVMAAAYITRLNEAGMPTQVNLGQKWFSSISAAKAWVANVIARYLVKRTTMEAYR
jgi:hypothetical protein